MPFIYFALTYTPNANEMKLVLHYLTQRVKGNSYWNVGYSQSLMTYRRQP